MCRQQASNVARLAVACKGACVSNPPLGRLANLSGRCADPIIFVPVPPFDPCGHAPSNRRPPQKSSSCSKSGNEQYCCQIPGGRCALRDMLVKEGGSDCQDKRRSDRKIQDPVHPVRSRPTGEINLCASESSLDRGRRHQLLRADSVLGKILRTAGRAGTAHIVLFRMVGIEGRDEEGLPELTNLAQQSGLRRGSVGACG